MRIPRLALRPLRSLSIGLLLLTLLPWACTRKTVSFNSTPDQPLLAVQVADSLTHTADSLKGKPSLSTARKAVLTKEQERVAKDAEKDTQRKSKKKKKNVFLGERMKRAFAKTGQGRNQIIEVFYFLKFPKPLNAYAPAYYFFDTKKHKILKLAVVPEDAPQLKIMHGPYKKLQNNKVLETGYYALGTKHLRWERYDKNGVLLSKIHYEMGFPRDANVSYYGEDRGKIHEVVPYVNGKLEGDYAKFFVDGRPEWRGQFENGHRIGVWTNFWGTKKNYRHYEYQYPESGYDAEVTEPNLLREYNRNAVLVFDKEKSIDKRGEPEPASPAPRGRSGTARPAPKAPTKVALKRR